MSAKKTVPKKTTARKATPKAKPKAAAKAKPQAKSPNTLLSNTLLGKAAKAAAGARRPPNNPTVPKQLIEMLTHDLGAIKEMLESFAAHLRSLDRCPKAYGFWARSLRYAQTPHIIRGVLRSKTPSYPA